MGFILKFLISFLMVAASIAIISRVGFLKNLIYGTTPA